MYGQAWRPLITNNLTGEVGLFSFCCGSRSEIEYDSEVFEVAIGERLDGDNDYSSVVRCQCGSLSRENNSGILFLYLY